MAISSFKFIEPLSYRALIHGCCEAL